MTDPTQTISIGRASLPGSLLPLEFSAVLDDVALGIVNYQAPARIAVVSYAPPSRDVHGSESDGASYAQSLLSYDWMCDTAADETALQAAYEEVCAAVGQFKYPVTTQISGAPAQVWTADMGSVTPPQRTFVDLEHPDALVVAIAIPVYPIPGSA